MSSKLKIKLHEDNGSYSHNLSTIVSVSVDVHQAYPDKGESPKASNGRHFKELVVTQYDSILRRLRLLQQLKDRTRRP